MSRLPMDLKSRLLMDKDAVFLGLASLVLGVLFIIALATH